MRGRYKIERLQWLFLTHEQRLESRHTYVGVADETWREGGRGEKRHEQFEVVYESVASPGIVQIYGTALANQPLMPLIVHHGRQLGSHSPAEINPYKWKEGGFVFTGSF